MNDPLPTEMAIFVHGPGCAAPFPNLPSPVVAVCRNCERIRERGRDHHAAQHSNQKRASSSHVQYSPICDCFTAIARLADFLLPLKRCPVLCLLDQRFSARSSSIQASQLAVNPVPSSRESTRKDTYVLRKMNDEVLSLIRGPLTTNGHECLWKERGRPPMTRISRIVGE